jgi:hypothetical protein
MAYPLHIYMLAAIFTLGMLTFITGVIILLIGIWGNGQTSLIAQANRIAQKGISEELAGLVGNTSLLISAINEMIRTRNGIGALLIFTGAALMIAAYWFAQSSWIF